MPLAGIENDTYPISTNVTNFTHVAKVRLEMHKQMHVQNERLVIYNIQTVVLEFTTCNTLNIRYRIASKTKRFD